MADQKYKFHQEIKLPRNFVNPYLHVDIYPNFEILTKI